MKKTPLILSVLLAGGMLSAQAAERDYVSIVGSSTVYPFATVVAETVGRAGQNKTPKIESTGTGGGMKMFCDGVSIASPDVTNASRRIKKSEFELCQKNGVTEIVEVLIGYDGIVIANKKEAATYDLTTSDLFLALAKQVPNPKNAEELIDNPYQQWNEINPKLPNSKIEVLGPPPTSGTRDAFVELVMESGCQAFPVLKALKSDKKAFKAACHTLREDGGYVEAGENDNLIIQKLVATPTALGIFGYSFLEQNADLVKGSTVAGVAPDFSTISSGQYSVSRPLYFYVKSAHLDKIPGLKDYVREFTSEAAFGDEGYLGDKGLIPLSEAERKTVRDNVEKATPLKL